MPNFEAKKIENNENKEINTSVLNYRNIGINKHLPKRVRTAINYRNHNKSDILGG